MADGVPDLATGQRVSGGLSGATAAVLSPGGGGTVNLFARTTDGHIAVFGQTGSTSA
ncbi:hypothetical protein [Kitasatospora sp. NBC_00315]|uniref:hypothetical protein n=1 Tax=Kitasatospora sp. NBC_00315 TaxID=2975963 RepID=UPI00324EAAE3